jgi:hypothetical protein
MPAEAKTARQLLRMNPHGIRPRDEEPRINRAVRASSGVKDYAVAVVAFALTVA